MYRGRGGGSWRGSGPSRGGRTRPFADSSFARRGGSSTRPRGVCHHFLAGRCTYGASCRYSHDQQDATGEATSENESSSTAMTAIRGDYIDFKRQLRWYKNSSYMSGLGSRQGLNTWGLVVKILDATSRELHQSVARDLADDELGGPAFVEQTVGICTTSQGDLECIDLARPFLQAMTHTALLRSLSIDSFVGVIYRLVGGHNGDRGIGFFAQLNQRLSEAWPSSKALLVLIVSSLYELLRRERKCLLHDDLLALLGALEAKITLVDAAKLEDATSAPADLDAARFQIGMMRRMADSARGRVSSNQPCQSTALGGVGARLAQSTFPLDVVIPGGQHDNDFADVTKIQIFPTLDEITSDAAEYLPTTDFTRPHFLADPVQRHLDASFRLLRHDIFGALKEVIGSLLAQPDLAMGPFSKRLLGGDIRAFTYSRASIQHVLVSKGGLETFLSFTQPPQLRNSSQAEKRRWWEESSRLESGNLVCFVSTRGDERSFLLFVVTRKNTIPLREDSGEGDL